jgi:Ca2+-binding RTX toxin-like protein
VEWQSIVGIAGRQQPTTTAAPTNSSRHITYNTATGVLSYDGDGNGAHSAVQFAALTNHPAPTSPDLLVI